jgi:hypothetical protein
VVTIIKESAQMTRNRYDLRAARWLVEKWELNPADYEFEFEW